jgi:uncharacterized Fe-S center protein
MPGTVYYIETADGEPLDKVITKLGRLIRKSGVLDVVSPGDFTAVKIHFGEEGNKTHIRPELAGEAVRQLLSRTHNVFLTDTNVLYKDSRRTNAVDHLRLAHEHGFDEARTRPPSPGATASSP